jgi:hypothetical protein
MWAVGYYSIDAGKISSPLAELQNASRYRLGRRGPRG